MALIYSYEIFYARDKASFLGIPKATNFSNNFIRIFRNSGFMVGYSEFKKNPLWVVYKLKPFSKNQKYKYKRPRRFKTDFRSFAMVSHSDYTRKNYDRGHLAPNYAISRIYGREAQLDTFLMTNISPQTPNFNQQIWKNLEIIAIDKFLKLNSEIWVVTGAIFDDLSVYLDDTSIEIPDSFYKIFIMQKDNKIYMLSFIIPQYAKKSDNLSKYLVTVDEIEKKTGFDFFHKLEDKLENRLESQIDEKIWQ